MGLAGSFGLLRTPSDSGSLAEGIYFGMHVPMKVIGGFAAAFVALRSHQCVMTFPISDGLAL